MKAIQFNHYGEPGVLQMVDVDMPYPNPDQILIQVKSFGINPIDWKLRSGLMQAQVPLNFPVTLGFEVAGIVTKTGKNVTRFKVGDHIYSRAQQSYAEYCLVDAAVAQIIPDFLDFTKAASLPSGSQVAYSALKTIGNIEQNQNVLIHAGAGGVGVCAIQIAKSFGAKVTTTASENNFALLKKLGADHIIDYKKTNLHQITERFDLILDSVGGKTQVESSELLNDTGTLVSLVSDEQNRFLHPLLDKKFCFMRGVQGNPSSIVHSLISEQKVRPVIDRIFDFHHVAEAHQRSQTGHVSGKIVITV
nr:NADP-dependent oxidoreductase [Acinetobacter sp. Marseille-Q1620]